MKKETVLYCHEFTGAEGDPGRKFFDDLLPYPRLVRACDGSPKRKMPVYKVRVSETKAFPGCYWAWWDNSEKAFALIYAHKGMVEMCFPYGTKAETKRGRGRVVPVKVEKIGRIFFDAEGGFVCL